MAILRVLYAVFAVVLLLPQGASAEPQADLPQVVLKGVPFSLELSDPDLAQDAALQVTLRDASKTHTVDLDGPGPVTIEGVVLAEGPLIIESAGRETRIEARILPGWASILPPLLAILLAIVFRQAVLALFVGVWLGAGLVFGGNPFSAFFKSVDTFLLNAVTDSGRATLLLFTFAMAGMLGVVHRMGGTQGIVELVSAQARSARSGQLATWAMGLLVFFDDYANTLMVGNTMRPITDRLKISREKLSYIVDSTAAPVATVALVSTWIGAQVGYINDAFSSAGIERDGYSAFLSSLSYSFYPFLALLFVFLVSAMGRDFGPMLKAEKRARRTGKALRPNSSPLMDSENEQLEPVPGKPHRWINAAVPILVTVGGIIFFLYQTGAAATREAGDALTLRAVLGNADSYNALLWASFLGSLAALVLAAGQRIMNVGEAVTAWIHGAKSVFMAAVILSLAWSISDVSSSLGTANYLVSNLQDTLSASWLPLIVFVLSASTAFATGSSWSTMGILMPLVIPLAHSIAPGNEGVMAGTIAGVLGGSVWGDHCSPISDTTVLSSMASSVDHMDHVNTQLPYALFVGGAAVGLGLVPAALGAPPWVGWVLAPLALVGALRLFGKSPEAEG